jgi:hypothetical protein
MKTPIAFELKTVIVFEAVIRRKGDYSITLTNDTLDELKKAVNVFIKDSKSSLESLSEVEVQEVV